MPHSGAIGQNLRKGMFIDMIQTKMKIEKNERIADGVFRMVLLGECGEMKPGQFVNIALDGFYLRRPISVCDQNGDRVTVIYKTVGEGTKAMSRLENGEELSVLCGLGNGFTVKDTLKPLLIGGGVGVPPMLLLAKALAQKGIKATAVLGFRSKGDVFLEKELLEYCEAIYVTTEDGSYGTKGFVTDVVNGLEFDYFYTCGPMPMLRALAALSADGQLSYEERMGCGFGGCMGCSCKKTNGDYARICKEGPVFDKGEITL